MDDLLERIKANNIIIEEQDSKLKLHFLTDTINQELISEIKERKEELLHLLQNQKNRADRIDAVSPSNEGYKLSSAQYRLWVLGQFEEGSVAYNMPRAITLEGEYNKEQLSNAIKQVIDRHEVLRTVFRENEEGEVRQWVLNSEEINFQLQFLDFTDHDQPAKQVEEYIQKDSFKRFDFENGPLLRAVLFQTEEKRFALYFNMHHIISDGWSIDVLSKDVLTYYKALSDNKEVDLEPLRVQYKDYASWQSEKFASEAFEKHKTFWLDQLSGELPKLNLPSFIKRPLVKTYDERTLETYLSEELSQRLNQFCRENSGSLFMGVLAGVNAILHRYTNQKDFIVGSPVAGRDQQELAEQIGCYINVLPFRNQVQENQSFLDLFGTVRENTIAAYDHQEYPFDKLIEDLNLKRDMGRSPVFDMMVVMQNISEVESDQNSDFIHSDQIKDLGEGKGKFDLNFIFFEIGDRISLKVSYNEDVYEKPLIEQLIRHFKSLLSLMLDKVDKPLGELNYMSQELHEELVYELNATDLAYSDKLTLVDIVESRTNKTPNNVSFIDENRSITYQELNDFSNQIGHELKEQNVSNGDYVCLHMSRSVDLIASLIGILKSGGVYVPFEPTIPAARKEHIIDQLKVKVIITDHENLDGVMDILPNLPQLEKIICLGGQSNIQENRIIGEEKVRTNSVDNLNISINPLDEAYIIFTSGSTGTPKGVVDQHQPVINLVEWVNITFNVSEDDKLLMVASISFDLSVYDIFGTILAGATGRIASHEELKGSERLVEILYDEEITFWDSAPGALSQLMPHILEKGKEGIKGKLRLVFMSGDWIPLPIADELKQCFENIRVIALGGATEAVIWSNYYPIGEVNSHWQSIPYGKPIHNAYYYVLDDQLNPCAYGVEGDLYIGGKVLAKEYKNAPELTSGKFLETPFKKGERIYKTGDRARFFFDGNLEFRGRKDHQVKIRGYRIELGEIEQNLLNIDTIEDAVVLAVGEDRGEKELIAYLVSSQTENLVDLRSQLRKNLPEYMLPGRYAQLDKIPVTVNGKVDKKKLAALQGLEMASGVNYVAASSEVEEALVEIWEVVLNREKIGVNDNFFDLGGDSIKSIQVVSRLRERGYKLKVEQILRNPVLRILAEKAEVLEEHISQELVTGEVVLAPIQKMFFEDDKMKNKNHYNQSVVLACKERIDQNGLKKCLDKIVLHHDALRMSFKTEGDLVAQINRGNEDNVYRLSEHDFISSDNPELSMEETATQIQRECELSNGALFRVGLFHLPKGDRLVLISHHLVIDGVSWRIILEDLAGLYDQFLNNENLVLPSKTVAYQTWTDRMQSWATPENLKLDLKYWKNFQKELEVSNGIQTNVEYKEEVTFIEESFQLSTEKTKDLQTQVNSKFGTKSNEIVLSAFAQSVKNEFGTSQFTIQLEGHGRDEVADNCDVSRTVGWFTSVYPVLLGEKELSDNSLDGLVRIKEKLRRIPHGGISYGLLQVKGEIKKRSAADVTFNYLGEFGLGEDEGKRFFSFSDEAKGNDSAQINGKFLETDLSITGIIESGVLTLILSGKTSRYNREVLVQLRDAFQDTLTQTIVALKEVPETSKTPVDFTFKGMTVDELNTLEAPELVEDVYKLSPLQEGMYFHWLANPNSAYYFQQFGYRIKVPGGSLEDIQKSFDYVVARHAVLRTEFTNDIAGELLQVVRKEASEDQFFITELLSTIAQEQFILNLKQEDREKGFDLSVGSQMRLTVVPLGNESYEFVWSCHHILMDGWCIGILVKEFYQKLYALISGSALKAESAPKYSDYLSWLDTINPADSKAYWATYLEDVQQPTGVPFKKQIDTPVENDYSKKSFGFEKEELEQLRSTCKRLEITENTMIQTAWGYLLSKYNATNDVVFGGVVSGRPGEIERVDEMVGLFINTIPVRINREAIDSPQGLMKKVQKEALESLPHHYANLSEAVSENQFGIELIDHILIFENYAIQDLSEEDGNDNMEILSRSSFDQNHYDFSIQIMPGRERMEICVVYNTNRYFEEGMNRLLDHFNNMIRVFFTEPQKHFSEVGWLNESEKTEVIDLAGQQGNYPKEKTVVSILEEQVTLTPNNVAVKFENAQLTYSELNAEANQLANYLKQECGVNKNDLVAVCLDRSEKMIVSLLAIIKAGAAYVPIDKNYPTDRIEYMLSDSNANYCIDDVAYEKFENIKEDFSNGNLNLEHSSSDLLYVIYTSGTTGKPKGALIEHGNVVSLMKSEESQFDFNEKDVWTLFHSYCFDFSVWEMYGALLNGGTLVIVADDVIKSPHLFAELLITEKVTVLNQTPSAFYNLSAIATKLESWNSALRYVVFGGEALQPRRLQEWQQKFPAVKLINMYGITETTVHVTYKEITADEIELGVSNIGQTLPTLNSFVLDDYNQLVPFGVPGELYVAGAGVCRGYLNRPELTESRFINIPFLGQERLYKTGDKVILNKNGEMTYLGRLDQQVKVRGYRIETREVEQEMERISGISRAVALVIAQGNEENELVSYFTADKQFNVGEIRAELLSRIPSFMVPSQFIQIDNFQLTVNGKLNKTALPDPTGIGLELATEYIAPTSDTEKRLVEIWEEVLNKDRVGVMDNFFDLGGHSIKALKVISRIYQEFDLKVDVKNIFNEPIIKELATEIENRLWLKNEEADDSEEVDMENLTI